MQRFLILLVVALLAPIALVSHGLVGDKGVGHTTCNSTASTVSHPISHPTHRPRLLRRVPLPA